MGRISINNFNDIVFMEDELSRQTRMAWERGRDYGLFLGITITIIFGGVINLLW
jgi:hypothetical protein